MTAPTVSDFKTFFTRDFPFGTDAQHVMDSDVQAAIDDAGFSINEGLFDTQAFFARAYLLLSAHFLVTALRASSQGIAGNYSWLQASKGVGSVNEAFSIPQKILDNPELAMLSKTPYGARYLMLILPTLAGNVVSVCGGTKP